jgi:arylsulfatase A-like enzyme
MTRQPALKIVLIVVLSLFLLQCSAEKKKRPKNVILITLDTHRADYVSAYDPEKSKTPNIDFFARQGILVENCYSLIPITAPAHASLFYSQPPHLLSLYNNGQVFHPVQKKDSLAELFRKKGIRTAAFVSLGVLQSHFQLHHGFDLYDDNMPSHRWYLNAHEINQKVLPWIEKNKGDDFFAWIHYSDPHDPYAPPTLPPDLRIELNGQLVNQLCLQKYEQLSLKFKLRQGTNKIIFTVLNPYPGSEDHFRAALNEIEFIQHPESLKLSFANIHFIQRDEKRSALIKKNGSILVDCPEQDGELIIRARGNLNLHPSEKTRSYREEVEYLDQQIGTLTKKLQSWDLIDKCLIVLVGDHGEGLGEDNTKFGDRYFGHIHYLYGAYMRVPLIIYDQTMEKKSVKINGLATILDVTPTILGRMGWTKKPYHRGRDLFKTKKTLSSILGETYTPEAIYDRFGMLQYPWHMVYTPETQKVELYNLISDPDEKNDVFDIHKNIEDFKNLQERLKQKAFDILESKQEVKIDKDNLDMLKSLGYIK